MKILYRFQIRDHILKEKCKFVLNRSQFLFRNYIENQLIQGKQTILQNNTFIKTLKQKL